MASGPNPVSPVTAFPAGQKFLNIAGAATTVVAAYGCTLARIAVNKAVASGIITIYDNASAASGTKVGTITHPATLLATQYDIEYGALVTNGIVIVTSAADDITVIFQ